ncbi:uncharacterized protein PAC_05834 [Phialocephala subalpina]|uniref:Uncharacterized protein n=1 Tax=Phialocephala subalpina TaxID=576137 RepID=A0A1L7WT71_9HELO|nr:uncharacterized protein PAC_05834 [Phialocephala subalpina]
MDSLRSLILQNRSILEPAFRTTASLVGCGMLFATSYALISPAGFADKGFKLPLPPFSPPPKSTKSSSPHPADPKAWLVPFAGREAAIGSIILTLLYFGELKALSLCFGPMMLAAVADTASVVLYGQPGEWMAHGIPTLLLSWVAPVGLVLYAGL